MSQLIERLSQQSAYRYASVLLLLASIGFPLVATQMGAQAWLAFLAGAAFYLLLVLVTYRRLRDAALSGGWIMFMLVLFNVGPMWTPPGPVSFHLGNLVNLIPVALGWIVATAAGANPKQI